MRVSAGESKSGAGSKVEVKGVGREAVRKNRRRRRGARAGVRARALAFDSFILITYQETHPFRLPLTHVARQVGGNEKQDKFWRKVRNWSVAVCARVCACVN